MSTSGLPQQNICATSGKMPWNLRVSSFQSSPVPPPPPCISLLRPVFLHLQSLPPMHVNAPAVTWGEPFPKLGPCDRLPPDPPFVKDWAN